MLDYVYDPIYDPIYGRIQIPSEVKDVLRTPEFLRLGDVHQLGGGIYSFPSASHKRLIHSLGVMHLVDRVYKDPECDIKRKISEDDYKHLLYAAILHDVGQGPFSHTTDGLLKKLFGKGDDERSAMIIRGEIKPNFKDKEWIENSEELNPLEEVLTESDIDKERIASIIERKNLDRYYIDRKCIPHLINSDLDLDKIDYIVRDTHFTGLVHGAQNPDFIIKHMTSTSEGELAFKSSGVSWVVQLLIARLHMYSDVYYARRKRVVEKMIERGLEYLSLEKKRIGGEDIISYTDRDVLNTLFEYDETREIYYRLKYGSLYESISEYPINKLDNDSIRLLKKALPKFLEEEVEKNLQDMYGIESRLDIILDIMGPLDPDPLVVWIQPESGEPRLITDVAIISREKYVEEVKRPLKIALYINKKIKDKIKDYNDPEKLKDLVIETAKEMLPQ